MSQAPSFKYLAEHLTDLGVSKARFTNEKHAKIFARKQKQEGIDTKLYLLTPDGEKGPEVKFR